MNVGEVQAGGVWDYTIFSVFQGLKVLSTFILGHRKSTYCPIFHFWLWKWGGWKGALYLVAFTPLYQVFLCKHSTSLIHNLTCLELSGLRGGRSTQIFWDYLYTTFLFGVIPSTLSAACDLGHAVFSSSNYSHFYYVQTDLLSVARWSPHYKSKFLGGRTFQSICGNTGYLGFVCLYVFLSWEWIDIPWGTEDRQQIMALLGSRNMLLVAAVLHFRKEMVNCR